MNYSHPKEDARRGRQALPPIDGASETDWLAYNAYLHAYDRERARIAKSS